MTTYSINVQIKYMQVVSYGLKTKCHVYVDKFQLNIP